MEWYHVLTLAALAFCLISCFVHLGSLISSGKPKDFSQEAGDIPSAVYYSFTGGMSPARKESAFLHLPTYTAGILYHTGTFLCIGLFILSWFVPGIPFIARQLISAFLVLSILSGIGILVKRVMKPGLRSLSNPDDYASNVLVTLFQAATLIFLHVFTPAYYIMVSILLLYLPLGKLKHTIYFFAARYHLGYFYGRRGVWPPKKQE